jgi:predicted DNA-binding WGR domain protein
VSDWDVDLIFVKGSSNKFWRARTDGGRLFVNYGRIGSNGQTQVKDFPSADKAVSEMEKVAAQKRRKGYWEADEDGEGAEAAPAEEAPKKKKAKDKGKAADLEMSAGGRKIELRLEQEGAKVRTVMVEHYDSDKLAGEAFDRIAGIMSEEGYKKVAARKSL